MGQSCPFFKRGPAFCSLVESLDYSIPSRTAKKHDSGLFSSAQSAGSAAQIIISQCNINWTSVGLRPAGADRGMNALSSLSGAFRHHGACLLYTSDAADE